LKRQLARFGDLLYACETLQEIESTLLVRVCHFEELSDACRVCQQEISRPFLMPWHTLPDTRETALIRTLHGHTGPVNGCAISPDGTWIVSASADKTLKLWDVHTMSELPGHQKYRGSVTHTLRGHKGPVTCCAISPDGTWIASTSEDQTLRIWDVLTGAQL